jgi:hypothetical protein
MDCHGPWWTCRWGRMSEEEDEPRLRRVNIEHPTTPLAWQASNVQILIVILIVIVIEIFFKDSVDDLLS